MFVKLRLYFCNGDLVKGFVYKEAGEAYINTNHVVTVRDHHNGFSVIALNNHGANSQSFVKATADELVKQLTSGNHT